MKRFGRCSAGTAAVLSLLLVGQVVKADTAAASQVQAPGEATRGWLEMQRSGAQAAVSPRQPGAVATRVYQRYLETFDHPVPESYFEGQKDFVSK
jgi:hypothetical protein